MSVAGYGKCTICGNHVSFLSEEGCSLRETRCMICQGTKRNRDLAKIISKTFLGDEMLSLAEGLPRIKDLSIYEAQSSGTIHRCLKGLPHYVCSEYFNNFWSNPGNNFGVRLENLENLSFPSDSFDLVITQDVLEHLRYPAKAFHEIHRVLKPWGYHIFTVPIHEGRKTVRRVEIREGKDVFILPPVHHGDSLRHSGSLVYTDFGEDIIDYLHSLNIHTEIAFCEKFYSEDIIPWIHDENSYRRYQYHIRRGDILKFFLYNSFVLKSQRTGI